MQYDAVLAILTDLYISFPQCLSCGLCALLILKPRGELRPGRLALYSLLLALFSSASYYAAFKYGLVTPRLIVYIAVNYALFRYVFGFARPLSQVAALLSTIAVIIVTVGGAIAALLTGMAFNEFFAMTPSLHAALIWYPFYVALPLAVWVLRKPLSQRLWDGTNLLYRFPRAQLVFWLLILQLALMTGGLMNIAVSMTDNMSLPIIFMSIGGFLLLLASSLALFYLSLQMAHRLHLCSIMEGLMQQGEEFLSAADAQREGFIECLGDLDELADRGMNIELGKVLNSLTRDLNTVNARLIAGNTLISAMLNAKLIQSEKCGVNLETDLDVPVSSPFIDRHSLEMIRIMGNLLDNALDAVKNLAPAMKWIRIKSHHIGPLHCLKISNPLSEDTGISESIFQPGYTSKGEGHSGMGLYIASTLASKMGGQLKFQIEPGPVVSFVLVIPR